MDKPLFDRIVQQLLSEMGDTGSRQALVQSALFGSPVTSQIDWSGAASEFTIRLVNRLYQYDVSALIALLEELKTQVGPARQTEIASLIQALSASSTSTKGQNMAVESGILIGFLLEIGRWAKGELTERWKLRHEQQTADLTNKAQAEATLPQQIENIAAEHSPRDVERITNLIERKRDTIDRARNAKLTHREERERGEITENMFVLRTKKEDETIRQMLDEIATDLGDLGFEVEREPA